MTRVSSLEGGDPAQKTAAVGQWTGSVHVRSNNEVSADWPTKEDCYG